MEIRTVVYVLMVASLGGLIGTAIASRSTVTSNRLLSAVACIVAFFAGWTGIILLEKRTIGVFPVAFFVWFSLFVFYQFGVRYVSGRGVFARPYHDDLSDAPLHLKSTSFVKVLKTTRHVLVWPVVALAIFVLARGLTGHGWVMTIP